MDESKIEKVKGRLTKLKELEDAGRSAVTLAGLDPQKWPLGNAIVATIADTLELCAEVARLSSQASGATLLNAVLGSLRADGYTVLAPGFDIPAADEPPASDGDMSWRGEDEAPGQEEPLPESAPASYRPLPPGSLGSGDCGPDSFGGQDAPHAPAVTPEPPVELYRGRTVRLVGNGLYADRHAILHDKTATGVWFGELTPSTFTPTRPPPTLPLGSFATTLPDPDKQPSLFTNTVPVPAAAKAPDAAPAEATATAPKPTRAPEADKPVSDWNPSDKEIAEMAALIGNGHTLESTKALLAKYKIEKASEPPRKRWRPDFVNVWAKAQPKA